MEHAHAPAAAGRPTLILVDDHSGFVVGHGVDDAERAAMVIRTFEEAVARHGKPERVMHDVALHVHGPGPLHLR